MTRIIYIFILLLIIVFIGLQVKKLDKESILPKFLIYDDIADQHYTTIEIDVHSLYIPVKLELENLKKDYSSIWAHMNNLYKTNDVLAGKEYYTEEWFNFICARNTEFQKSYISRNDLSHELHIINWSSDQLVCTAIDSNVVFMYEYSNDSISYSLANIAIAMLKQGDNWRIDAIKILNERNLKYPN